MELRHTTGNGSNLGAYPLNITSIRALCWAAHEVAASLRAEKNKGNLGLPQRLHMLIHEARPMVRSFFEDKVLDRIKKPFTKPSTADGATSVTVPPPTEEVAKGLKVPNTPLPTTLPTANDLKAVGLTFARLRQLDATITPKVLMISGVVKSWTDVEAMGVHSFGEFINQVACPHEVAMWLRKETGSHLHWKRDFLPGMNFTIELWKKHCSELHPLDLVALDFCLGAYVATSDREKYDQFVISAPQWLLKASPNEWITSGQLTDGQYESLAQHLSHANTTNNSR